MKTKYRADFPELARGFAEQGKTDEEIWQSLGIERSAYYDYQNKHLDFAEAIKEGKRKPNEEVEAALKKIALGYTYQEKHAEPDPRDKTGKRMKVVRVIEKAVLPNVTAQIFWLKNRMREKWRDVRDVNAVVANALPLIADDSTEDDVGEVLNNLRRLMPDAFNGNGKRSLAGKN